ncbi:hypothetical protein K432DRAFT_446602 [Lepidopterella palustris CBS 459.81]|uniref:Uncharacterized protein n=1 Tax=Lepidopterella palustris CBS 459.81 TaxID=1314670 RepID=A0A8E2JB74_9PEZI|nr:hypothetical protein K432DRAFT_446602 [Lepidopterella palustris CBS 459.81]
MAPLEIHGTPGSQGQLSNSVLVAIVTAVGVFIVLLLVGLGLLLVRAVRTHKRLLADLEERGITIAPPPVTEANQPILAKPRAVLGRNTLLPFNSRSGWGTLSSHENITQTSSQSLPQSIPPHATDSRKNDSGNKESKRLSWPFSRRTSGGALQLKKIRLLHLSATVESPRTLKPPSPLYPALTGPKHGEPSSPVRSKSRPSSDQSLLKHHPALRSASTYAHSETSTVTESEQIFHNPRDAATRNSLQRRISPRRSKPMAAIPSRASLDRISRIPRPKTHTRSTSLCGQTSGHAPDSPMPPLSLEVARIKGAVKPRVLLSRSPSRFSVSSFESARSSILTTQSTPITFRSNSLPLKKVAKREWRNSLIVGPRPIRDTLTLRGRINHPSQGSIKSNIARYSVASPPTRRQSMVESGSSSVNSSSQHFIGKVNTAKTVRLSRESSSSPAGSIPTVQSMTTPRRQLGTNVNLNGSPQERRKTSVLRDVSGNQLAPSRQLSQTSTQASSTRSSNGNPFQWDPTPLQSGKLSALKGSPSARKGHRRQNCVRISLAPTILGPSRSSSPSAINDILEEPPDELNQKSALYSTVIRLSSMRSLPRPPSSSVFAPDVKINPTSIRASSTPSSPTLLFGNHGHDNSNGSPTLGRYSNSYRSSLRRYSTRQNASPIFIIPHIPSPCHDIRSIGKITSSPPTFEFCRPSNKYVDGIRLPEPPVVPSSSFSPVVPDSAAPTLQQQKAAKSVEEYDPNHPRLIYPTAGTNPPIQFSSPFTTIPCESFSSRKHARSPPYSPPCSTKTILPDSFNPASPTTTSTTALNTTSFLHPQVTQSETIDPAFLTYNIFNLSSSSSSTLTTASAPTPTTLLLSAAVDTAAVSTHCKPLVKTAFPSQPGTCSTLPNPTPPPPQRTPSCPRSHTRSQSAFPPTATSSPTSTYSLTTPTSRPSTPPPPSSPRPAHAHASLPLPLPSPLPLLSQIETPTLLPKPLRPRASTPKDLMKTVAALRRMNSDARGDGLEGRGVRRYLKLGKEASVCLSGEVSWGSILKREGEEEEDGDGDQDRDGILTPSPAPAPPIESSLATNLNAPTDTDLDLNLEADVATLFPPRCPSLPWEEAQADAEAEREREARSSSVWEDGEKFWSSKPPLDRHSSGPGEHRKKGRVTIVAKPPSRCGTPGSLYDAEGFLRA